MPKTTAVQRYFASVARTRADALIAEGRCRKCGAPAKTNKRGKPMKHCATCIAREAGRVLAKRAMAGKERASA